LLVNNREKTRAGRLFFLLVQQCKKNQENNSLNRLFGIKQMPILFNLPCLEYQAFCAFSLVFLYPQNHGLGGVLKFSLGKPETYYVSKVRRGFF
jgi:hypothetical protein